VPDRAVGRFSLRARDLPTLGRVERAFRREVVAAARTTGARAVVRSVDHPYAEMVTNRTLAKEFKTELARLGRRTVDTPRKGMGSLDMGNVSKVVPAIHPFVAIAPRSASLHSARFARYAGGRRGAAGLRIAARALANVALTVLCNEAILDRARREFAASRRRPGAR
jgi:metal-dependent amidase/aminoacylase/carboxypeptidase family protein